MSNALESASLIMYPSGYSNGVLGSLKPTDGSGDFTFTRGSNLSATRVGPNGYIEKGYENLLLQSNSFLTTWTTTRATISGGQSGYDGANDAWLLNSTDPSSSFVLQSVNVSGIKTISIYAKANTANWILMYSAGGSIDSWFDIQNGQLGSKGAGAISTHIETIGNGWYRCSVLLTNNISDFRVYVSNGNNSFLSAVGDSVYIQDAMLNQGLVAYPYIETTTAPVAGGILEDEPRIDFSDGCGHLLLEPSRTNLITHSEFYTFDGGWRLIGITPEYGYGISPEGLKNSVKISQSSSVSARIESVFALSLSAGVDYTFSFFVKNIDAALTLIGGTSGSSYEINWSGAEISSVTTGLNYKDFGNGWYRVWETSASSGSTIYRIYPDRVSPYTGSIEIYGTQAEDDGAGGGSSYPTSYIPTYGVSQTRLEEKLADSIDIGSFTSTYNTLFFDWGDMEGKSTFNKDIVRGWATMDNTFPVFRIVSLTDGRLRYQVYTSGFSESADYTCTTRDKVAFVFNGLNSKLFINGSLVYAYSLDVTQGLRKFNYNGFSRNITNQFIIFPTALSDDECIALTSL